MKTLWFFPPVNVQYQQTLLNPALKTDNDKENTKWLCIRQRWVARLVVRTVFTTPRWKVVYVPCSSAGVTYTLHRLLIAVTSWTLFWLQGTSPIPVALYSHLACHYSILSFKMTLIEGHVCQMYEIDTDKVMMVCMPMIRIYVVNVTASSQKKEWHLFLWTCKGQLESLKLCACLKGHEYPSDGGRGLALSSLLALVDRSVPVGVERRWLPASSAWYLPLDSGWPHLSAPLPSHTPTPTSTLTTWRREGNWECKPCILMG